MTEPRIDEANTAAHPGAPAPAGPSGTGAPRRAGRPGRLVALVLSALVVAFCAWSMGEYVAGRDPLAFLAGSTAGQATGASGSAAGGGNEADGPAPDGGASGLSADEVADEIGEGLSFEGHDLSLPAGDVRVVLAEGGVWVEQDSRDGAEALVGDTARRAAALGDWAAARASELGVVVPQVTWVTEDADGVVRMVVSFACDDAPTTGDVARLLAAARGYRVSADTYAALGDVSFAAAGGEAPALPDGEALPVDAAVVREDGTDGPARLVSEGAAGPAAQVPTSGAGGGAPRGSAGVSVSVSVGSRSATVSLPAGSTALDALRATGASVETGSNPTGRGGSWVYAIDGRGQEGSHGWTYAVNGREPGVMSDQCVLSDGDVVVWSYV